MSAPRNRTEIISFYLNLKLKEFLTKILNKEQRKTAVELILTPFSWLYGAGVWLRNAAFNMGILKQESFDVPVVSAVSYTHLTLPTKA